jgi:hypothetical protein
LAALTAAIHPALVEIRRHLTDQAAACATGTVTLSDLGDRYEACRRADQRLVLVRRFWRWYADRFDQRRDPATAAVLRAADEIVWSCWEPIGARRAQAGATDMYRGRPDRYRRTGRSTPHRPAGLGPGTP